MNPDFFPATTKSVFLETDSETLAEGEEKELKEKKRERRELEQTRHNAEDKVESLLKNPNIPESVKKKMEKLRESL